MSMKRRNFRSCWGKRLDVLNEIRHCKRMQAELESEDVDVGDVRDLLTKLTETMSKKRSELQLHRDDGLELHVCFSLDDPVVPLDLPEQWDDLTGKALDMAKVVKGRLKELQKLKRERSVCACSSEDAMQYCTGKFVKTRWVQTVKGDEVRQPLFAARLSVSRTASSPEPQCTLMVLDVSCAFLYADINRRVYNRTASRRSRMHQWDCCGEA